MKLKVKSKLKAGGIWDNHSATRLRVKTKIKAGGNWQNHNQTRR